MLRSTFLILFGSFLASTCLTNAVGDELVQTTPAESGETHASIVDETKTLSVLFIGNSYTARHNLSAVVKRFAETADPTLSFEPTTVIYGGRTLKDHWRLGTAHFVNQHRVTAKEVELTINALEADVELDPKDKYAIAGVKQLRSLLEQIESGTIKRTKWDWVVLQSYRDDLNGDKSLYMQFAPRFAALARAHGARVLLYETTPTTQNQFPIAQHQDSTAITQKAKSVARLAAKTHSRVAPMSYVALRCQLEKPNVTLRFENDAHLNQTMAYLTACTIYAAMFNRSPENINIDSVTDIRYWKNDRSTKKDRDGKPITRMFTEQEQAFFQRTAWLALQDFQAKFGD